MTESLNDILPSLLKQLPADLKAEVLVAELLASGEVEIEQLVLNPRSLFSRSYSPDVAGVQSITYSEPDIKQWFFDLNRESLYDTLPEGLFHQGRPREKGSVKSAEQMVEETRLLRLQEKEVRSFFLPFDTELNRQRIYVEQNERRLLTSSEAAFQHDLFELLWGETGLILNTLQKNQLLACSIIAHRLVGDWEATAKCYENVLQDPVTLTPRWLPVAAEPLPIPGLGEATLGADTVLEASNFCELNLSIRIGVGPIPANGFIAYLPTQNKHQLLCFLNRLLLPVEAEWELTTVVLLEGKGFVLADPEMANSRLGYTTMI